MKEIFDKIIGFVKTNWIISALVVLVFVFLIFPKQVKRIFGGRPHADSWYTKAAREKRVLKKAGKTKSKTKSGKALPRSAGKGSGKGYPKVGGGFVPFVKNKDGSIKKAAFVSGTIAARNRMKKIRKMK